MPHRKNISTKLQLWNSLYDLVFIQKIEFNQITINDICTHAVVHRSTFYNHFTDKFALYKFGYEYFCEKKNAYSVYQRMYAPFRTANDVNQSLQISFFSNHSLAQSNADFIFELQKAELNAVIEEFTPLGYRLTISKNIIIDLLLSMHKVLTSHLEAGYLTITEADSIIEKQINQLIIRSSKSKVVTD